MSDDERRRILLRRAGWVAAAAGVAGVGGFIAFRALGSTVQSATCLSMSVFPGAASGKRPTPETFTIVIHIQAEDGKPVDGARILRFGELVGVAVFGRASFDIDGTRSEVVALELQCPTGYRRIPIALSVALVPGMTELHVTCPLASD
jgi:hypothetical protein